MGSHGSGGLSGAECRKQGTKTPERGGSKQVDIASLPTFPRTTSFAKEVFGLQLSKTLPGGGVPKRRSLVSIFTDFSRNWIFKLQLSWNMYHLFAGRLHRKQHLLTFAVAS